MRTAVQQSGLGTLNSRKAEVEGVPGFTFEQAVRVQLMRSLPNK